MLGILNMVLRSLRSLLALVSASAVLATPPCPAPPVRVCRAPRSDWRAIDLLQHFNSAFRYPIGRRLTQGPQKR